MQFEEQGARQFCLQLIPGVRWHRRCLLSFAAKWHIPIGVRIKKFDLGQTVATIANIGVVTGLALPAMEIHQANLQSFWNELGGVAVPDVGFQADINQAVLTVEQNDVPEVDW